MCPVHDHDVCEQLMAAAQRSGSTGRLEYLATRCDMTHGRIPTPAPDERARETETAAAEEAL